MLNPGDVVSVSEENHSLARKNMKLRDDHKYYAVATEYAFVDYLNSQNVKVELFESYAKVDLLVYENGKKVYIDVKTATYWNGALSKTHTMSNSEITYWKTLLDEGHDVRIASFSQIAPDNFYQAKFERYYDVDTLLTDKTIKLSHKQPTTSYFYTHKYDSKYI